jgi:hypothetical protein
VNGEKCKLVLVFFLINKSGIQRDNKDLELLQTVIIEEQMESLLFTI